MKNQSTPAPSAGPSVTTQTIDSIATALTADSPQPLEIRPFIEGVFKTLDLEAYSGVKHSAEGAARHGFSNCANSRFVDFLEDFRSLRELGERYAESYPNCVFLPWKSIHRLLGVLNCWFELPQHYVGAIPASQLPWMDLFAWESERDKPQVADFIHALGPGFETKMEDRIAELRLRSSWHTPSFRRLACEAWEQSDAGWSPFPEGLSAENRFNGLINQLRTVIDEFRDTFFVMAPPEAFQTKSDWITRTRDFVEAELEKTVPPDDPLVLKPCYGGCLCVAAWGEEAAALNRLTTELGI